MNIINTLSNQKDLEIEIKIGRFYSGNQFSADVSPVIYHKLLDSLKGSEKKSKSIVCLNKGFRTEFFLNNKNDIMETIQTKKTNIKKIDLVEKLLILKNVKSIFNNMKINF